MVVMWQAGLPFNSMSYLVLARKYRPRQFTELVGQQHVAATLLNAFKQNKIGQAYLFTGTRGVGKTSVARIFAKAIRCEDPESQAGGKNRGISCDKCASCLEINNGSSIDVLEIDGASNNGVENVREIREQVKFLPSRGTMKVYIIDEVHMLTNAAFNALLKTLEEPPAHVTFILATTEVQKIPATILSRCQRFDFKRVPQPLIVDHLARILKMEGIKSDIDALRLIARKGDGSVRDALSAMDQCLALITKPELQIKTVTEALGIVSGAFIVKLLDHVFKREIVEAAHLVKEAFYSGVEMKLLSLSIAESLRTALFVKLGADASITELSDEEKKEFEVLVKNLSSETIQAAYKSMSLSLEEVLRSPIPRTSLEMSLARIAGIGHLQSIETILAGLGKSHAEASASPPAAVSEPTGFQKYPSPKAPEKKNPEVEKMASRPEPMPEVTAAPKKGEIFGFRPFVDHLLALRASLGALLEHAVSETPDSAWPSAQEIKLGFRKNHSFYQAQALHKANFEQLEKALHSYLNRKVRLHIVSLASDPNSSLSMVESETKNIHTATEEIRKRFLDHEVVKNTKEIFGAELASFDIDRSKL